MRNIDTDINKFPSDSLDISILWISKNSWIYKKLSNTEYSSIRRLSMMKLYLLNAVNWENFEIIWDKILWAEIFQEIWMEDLNKMLKLWLRTKDALKIINKAYNLYHSESPLQYWFDFTPSKKKDYRWAIEFLEKAINNNEYFEWELRWYVKNRNVIQIMMIMAEKFHLIELIPEFKRFINNAQSEDWLVSKYLLDLFYRYIISLLKNSEKEKNTSAYEIESNKLKVEWIIKED